MLNRNFNVTIANKRAVGVHVASGRLQVPDTEKILSQILTELKQHRRELETLRIAATSETMREVHSFFLHQVLAPMETLKALAATDVSLARFGDGEFRIMLRDDFNLRFQPNSEELQNDLKRVLQADNRDVLVGMPQVFRDAHWSGVYEELWPVLREMIRPDQRFGCMHITRPQFFTTFGQAAVELWRQVWEDKRVVIVTGEGSRFDLLPELFDNVRSIDFVLGSAVGAYDQIDELTGRTLESEADLALLSLGPTATVLASRLASQGLRALDIGHLTGSYQSAFAGGPRPEAMPIARKQAAKG